MALKKAALDAGAMAGISRRTWPVQSCLTAQL
jgi:hypothetical protein